MIFQLMKHINQTSLFIQQVAKFTINMNVLCYISDRESIG